MPLHIYTNVWVLFRDADYGASENGRKGKLKQKMEIGMFVNH